MRFKEYLEKTLDDVKEIEYEKGTPKEIITSFMDKKIGMLSPEEVEGKGQAEIKFFIQLMKDNPSIQIPSINASRVYISGPMTKHPYVNYHSFYLAEAILILGGIQKSNIINPATIFHHKGSGWVDFMIEDLYGMFNSTDTLVLLEGWETSLGARVEKACAENSNFLKNVINSYPVNEETYDYKGDVEQENVTGNDLAIFESNPFQSVLKKISVIADVQFDYIYEMFKASKVFQSIRNIQGKYQTKEMKNLIDMTSLEKNLAEAIRSLNIIEESKKPNKIFKEYFERTTEEAERIGYGLTFVDIDETLFETSALISVKDIETGEVIKKLTNQEFNTYVLEDGEEFDFGEFKNAEIFNKTSKPIKPVIQRIKQMLNRIEEDQSKSTIILLTARGDFDDKELFLQTFRDVGIPIDRSHVIRSEKFKNDNKITTAEAKKRIIIQCLRGKHKLTRDKVGEFTRVRLLDDGLENIKVFKTLENSIPNDILEKTREVRNIQPNDPNYENPIKIFPLLVQHGGKIKLL